jgi:hypothetical protein
MEAVIEVARNSRLFIWLGCVLDETMPPGSRRRRGFNPASEGNAIKNDQESSMAAGGDLSELASPFSKIATQGP